MMTSVWGAQDGTMKEEVQFWGKAQCPRDAPMPIEAPVTEAVDSWGW